jgi:hypothetical protein
MHHSASSLLQTLPVFPATPRPTKFVVRFGKAADPVLLPQTQRCSIFGTTFSSSWFCFRSTSHPVACNSVRIDTTPITFGRLGAAGQDYRDVVNLCGPKLLLRDLTLASNVRKIWSDFFPAAAFDNATQLVLSLKSRHENKFAGSCCFGTMG